MSAGGARHAPQGELLLPLLQAIDDEGGEARSTDVRERIADALGLTREERSHRVRAGSAGALVNQLGRTVRWVFKRAALAGLATAPAPGVWALTDRGAKALHNAHPGIVVRVFETGLGVMLWGDAESVAGVIEDGSLDLYFSSLPYADQDKPYEGQLSPREHVEWALGLAEKLKPKLREAGSFVLNVAAGFVRGVPVESSWVERLVVRLEDEIGLVKCQTLYWHNPARLPSPAEWVCVRRERVIPDVEPVLWFAAQPHPYVDQRAVLRPYSAAMRARIRAGGERGATRPSGHALRRAHFGADNGGAIPGALLRAANTDSNSYYHRRCRETGIPVHPARCPPDLPEFLVRMLTPSRGAVGDLCSGSGETPAAAERLGRRWVATDLSLTYVRGSAFHFERDPSYRAFLPAHLQPRPPAQTDAFAPVAPLRPETAPRRGEPR